MPSFSEVVYRGYGPHQRKGGGFSTLGVYSPEALDVALKDGWYRTLPEAIEAYDNPKPKEAPAPAPEAPKAAEEPAATAPTAENTGGDASGASVAASEPAVDATPPTRAELEQKAAELGIKFNKRTTDKKLGELIAQALP